jgi:hypothetical protein
LRLCLKGRRIEENLALTAQVRRDRNLSKSLWQRNSFDKPRYQIERDFLIMKTPIITALAAIALAGFGGWAEAGDHGYLGGSPHLHGSSYRSVGVSVGVPLFFYTSPEYTSSIYGSPGYSPYYYGSSAYSSKYYMYQANPWYADKTLVRYAVAGGTSTTAAVQIALARRGYYDGDIDGVIGSMSRTAILRYQNSHGLPPTGAIDYALLRALGMR